MICQICQVCVILEMSDVKNIYIITSRDILCLKKMLIENSCFVKGQVNSHRRENVLDNNIILQKRVDKTHHYVLNGELSMGTKHTTNTTYKRLFQTPCWIAFQRAVEQRLTGIQEVALAPPDSSCFFYFDF